MARMLAERFGRSGRCLAALAAAAWVIGLAAGCRGKGDLRSPKAPVILVSIDTLRADHLPAYGYTGVATPNLDALRADAVLFGNAYSHVPLTLPSHTTIFTGLLPPQNGVRDNLGYALGPQPATLAAFLKANGYATGGAVSSIVLSHATGVARGFDFWEDNIEPTQASQSISRVQRGGADTEALLSDWVSGHAAGPFFAFLHLFEPHSPYEPPEPYRSRYPLLYDGEIARADEILGQFVRFLKDRDIYDRALVIFLSDHGEGLNDHGEDEHGVLLYREEIHVPLMVKFPKSARRGETVMDPVALVDVFPTVADVLGLPAPAGARGTLGRGPPARARRAGGGRPPDLQRDALSAPAPRLERSRLARRFPRPLHRLAARGALRHRGRSRREERPLGRPSAGVSLDARRALADAEADAPAGRLRSRAGQEARGARLHQRDDAPISAARICRRRATASEPWRS